MQYQSSKGRSLNFAEGYYVLVAREYFGAEEKPSLHDRGLRWVVKPVNNFTYQADNIWNGLVHDIHIFWLKSDHDPYLCHEADMLHVLASEIRIILQFFYVPRRRRRPSIHPSLLVRSGRVWELPETSAKDFQMLSWSSGKASLPQIGSKTFSSKARLLLQSML